MLRFSGLLFWGLVQLLGSRPSRVGQGRSAARPLATSHYRVTTAVPRLPRRGRPSVVLVVPLAGSSSHRGAAIRTRRCLRSVRAIDFATFSSPARIAYSASSSDARRASDAHPTFGRRTHDRPYQSLWRRRWACYRGYLLRAKLLPCFAPRCEGTASASCHRGITLGNLSVATVRSDQWKRHRRPRIVP